ncbi:MAG: hypothetical protein NTY19_30395 [Planctomycetota bacterium]|nr:hypothetical protein [Planctomycetota bacterium]
MQSQEYGRLSIAAESLAEGKKTFPIAVQLAGGKMIRVSHAETRFTATVNLAADRVAHAVGRALKRGRKRTARTRPWESEPAD